MAALDYGSLQRRRDLALNSGARLFYDTPLDIVRGDGIYIGVAKMSVGFWPKAPTRSLVSERPFDAKSSRWASMGLSGGF